MRSTLLTLVLTGSLAPGMTFAQAAATHEPEARGNASVSLAGKTVTIDYGRPNLNGRDPLKLAAVGKPWRMGKDGATTLSSEADLAFGDVKVPKGTYVLTATKLEGDKWMLNITDKERKKQADVPLTAAPADPAVELFTIALKGEKNQGELALAWGTVSLKTAFTAN